MVEQLAFNQLIWVDPNILNYQVAERLKAPGFENRGYAFCITGSSPGLSSNLMGCKPSGKAADFGSAIEGSNPSIPTK